MYVVKPIEKTKLYNPKGTRLLKNPMFFRRFSGKVHFLNKHKNLPAYTWQAFLGSALLRSSRLQCWLSSIRACENASSGGILRFPKEGLYPKAPLLHLSLIMLGWMIFLDPLNIGLVKGSKNVPSTFALGALGFYWTGIANLSICPINLDLFTFMPRR